MYSGNYFFRSYLHQGDIQRNLSGPLHTNGLCLLLVCYVNCFSWKLSLYRLYFLLFLHNPLILSYWKKFLKNRSVIMDGEWI